MYLMKTTINYYLLSYTSQNALRKQNSKKLHTMNSKETNYKVRKSRHYWHIEHGKEKVDIIYFYFAGATYSHVHII